MVTISDVERAMSAGDLEVFFRGEPVLSIRELHAVTREAYEPVAGGNWRTVGGYQGKYEVSDTGLVRRSASGQGTYKGRLLKQYVTPLGYKQVRLRTPEGGSKLEGVHRLVARAFIGVPPTDDHGVLHWDDDPGNNEVSNLRWGTQSENLQDAVRNGTHYWARRTECSKGHPLSGDNVKPRGGREGGRRCVTCTRERQREWYRERGKK